MVNIKDFGAKGDGVTDDTPAIRRAIFSTIGIAKRSSIWPPILYLPQGVYLVKDTIEKRQPNQRFGSGLILQGAGQDQTVLRLMDKAPGFTDPQKPKALIFTSSHLYGQGGATGGGKDWIQKGEGNQAFQNSIRDLTVDVGSKNPGAIGIDYLANNQGAIRNVTVRAGKNSGATGISMIRKWPGPALLESVSVDGFTVGVEVHHQNYSVTLDGVTIQDYHHAALINRGNIVATRKLTTRGPSPAIKNMLDTGQLILVEANLQVQGNALKAIVNNGNLFLLRSNVHNQQGHSAWSDGAFRGTKQQLLSLPRNSVWPGTWPNAPQEPLNRWTNVAAYGAKPSDGKDDSIAFQAAVNSGASTLYLSYGTYQLSKTIHFPPTLQRVFGMNSELLLSGPCHAHTQNAVFDLVDHTSEIQIEDLRIKESGCFKKQGDQSLVFVVKSHSSLILRDILQIGRPDTVLVHRSANGGVVYLDNVCCSRFTFAGPAPVFARQLNTEGSGVRIALDGTPLWVLGVKSELPNILIDAKNGANILLLGGLTYPIRKVPTTLPVVRLHESAGFFVFGETIHADHSGYNKIFEVHHSLKTSENIYRNQIPGYKKRLIINGLGVPRIHKK